MTDSTSSSGELTMLEETSGALRRDVNGSDSKAGMESKIKSNAKINFRMLNPEEDETPENCSTKWSRFVVKVHQPVLVFLHAISQLAARNPIQTVVCLTLLGVAMMSVGMATNFTFTVEESVLWTPFGSATASQRDLISATWTKTHLGAGPIALPFVILVHANGKNILGQEPVGRLFDILDHIRSLDSFVVACNKSGIGSDMEQTCEGLGAVQFWNSSASAFREEVRSDEDVIQAMSALRFPNMFPVPEDDIFGYPQRNATSNLLTSVTSYSISIKLPAYLEWWDQNFIEDALDATLQLRETWAADPEIDLKIEAIAHFSIRDEFITAIFDDIPLIPIAFVTLSILTMIAFTRRHKVHSRSLLGFGAVFTCLLSITTGYGLLFIFGIPVTPATQLLPFIILGIGLDDAFIIMGSFDRQYHLDTLERVRLMVDDIGVSIVLTSATSSLAFALGCFTSNIPAIYWLCLYAFPMIIIDFIYQITFFIALLVLDERRIKQNRRDVCICITVPTGSLHQTESNSLSCPDSSVSNEITTPVNDTEKMEITSMSSTSNDVEHTENAATSGTPGYFADRWMKCYGEFLLRPAVKAVVVLGFSLLAAMGAYSASKLTQKFLFMDLMPHDSYALEFFTAFERYSSQSEVSPHVYFHQVDQSDEKVREQMELYMADLVGGVDAIIDEPEICWVRDLKAFAENSGIQDLGFKDQLDQFLSVPTFQEIYGRDIMRDDNGMVLRSRCKMSMSNMTKIDNLRESISALKQQREVTLRQSINKGSPVGPFFLYNVYFNIWEFYAICVQELIWTIVIGVFVVGIISLLFIPHWTAAFFIVPLVCVLNIELLGVIQWAGLHIDMITYVTVILGVGLFVDYLMHVLFRYYESAGHRHEKIVELLSTMGTSILLGGLSTLMGLAPLLFSTTSTFHAIFIPTLGLVALGLGHGLILLPVLLSMFGPEVQIKFIR